MKCTLGVLWLAALLPIGCSARSADMQASNMAPDAASLGGAREHKPAQGTVAGTAASALDGSWIAVMCDRQRPDLECGRFGVHLVQIGDRLCGSYFGARIGLSQIDEGGPKTVKGQAIADGAVLTVRSSRNGAIYLARLSRRQDALHWQVVDTVVEGDNDVDIIALDSMLERDGSREAQEQYASEKAACLSDR